MTDTATSDLWWKNAAIYCADVATWLDPDGDGTGDLAGLTRRLDYLRGLGINTLWLMPFTYLRSLVEFLERRRGNAIFLGEANVSPEEQQCPVIWSGRPRARGCGRRSATPSRRTPRARTSRSAGTASARCA